MIITEIILLKRKETDFRSGFCLIRQNLNDLKNNLQLLNTVEYDYYQSLKFEKRQKSYLLGRISAKQAVMKLSAGQSDPKSFYIDSGVFQFPVVKNNNQNIQVSISHCDDYGISLAFPEDHPMGVDMEYIDKSKADVIDLTLTEKEKELIKSSFNHTYEGNTIFWTVKEALSKIIKTGFTTDPKIFEIKSTAINEDFIVCEFEHFFQYKSISYSLQDYVITIVLPKNTVIDSNQLTAIFRSVEQNKH